MAEKNILISNPGEPGYLKEYSIENPEFPLKLLEIFEERQISPKTHPKLVDVFSGEQGAVIPFIKAGWQKQNITCIDKGMPVGEKQAGTTLTWDLAALESALKNNETLPAEVKAHKGQYDIFTAFYAAIEEGYGAFYSGDFLATIADFLLKKGGIAFLDSNQIKFNKKFWKLGNEFSIVYTKK